MLVSSSSAPVVIFLCTPARLVFIVVFVHEEEYVDVKLVASELTVVVAPISRLLVRKQPNTLGTGDVDSLLPCRVRQ